MAIVVFIYLVHYDVTFIGSDMIDVSSCTRDLVFDW